MTKNLDHGQELLFQAFQYLYQDPRDRVNPYFISTLARLQKHNSDTLNQGCPLWDVECEASFDEDRNSTILIESIRSNKPFHASAILNAGANPNQWCPTGGGGYPLTWAANHNELSTAMDLLRKGALVNAEEPTSSQDPVAMSALFYAVHHGHVDLVQFLLQHGASFENSQHLTASQYLQTIRHKLDTSLTQKAVLCNNLKQAAHILANYEQELLLKDIPQRLPFKRKPIQM